MSIFRLYRYMVVSGNKNNQTEIKIEIDEILRSANIRLA